MSRLCLSLVRAESSRTLFVKSACSLVSLSHILYDVLLCLV